MTYVGGLILMDFTGWIEVLMLLLMIESLADFLQTLSPAELAFRFAHVHKNTLTHTCTHTQIFHGAHNTASNLISADVVTHEMVPSLSLLRWYVKTADCLIQPPILTLWPPLNIFASLPQSPRLSWRFSTANNSGISMQVFTCVLWSWRENYAATCVYF